MAAGSHRVVGFVNAVQKRIVYPRCLPAPGTDCPTPRQQPGRHAPLPDRRGRNAFNRRWSSEERALCGRANERRCGRHALGDDGRTRGAAGPLERHSHRRRLAARVSATRSPHRRSSMMFSMPQSRTRFFRTSWCAAGVRPSQVLHSLRSLDWRAGFAWGDTFTRFTSRWGKGISMPASRSAP